MKLRQRELPAIVFERDLPEFLADDKPCRIVINARPGGGMNDQYMAAAEGVQANALVMDAVAREIEDAEKRTRQKVANNREIMRQKLALVYDTCVIDWRTDIIDADTGAPVEATRENFLSLAEQHVPEIAQAIADFEDECREAGRIVQEQDEETAKN